MESLLWVLTYLTSAVMLAVNSTILWRYRKRSRKAATLAFAALCGLAGLWLFGIAFHILWQNWLAVGPVRSDVFLVLRAYSLVHSGLNAVCLVVLVAAVVADRPAPGEPLVRDRGPTADFDDSPPGELPR